MTEIKQELREIIKSVKAYMEAERLAGIDQFYLEPSLEGKLRERPRASGENLEQLYREVSECRQCSLHKHRKNIVVGQGNPRAKLIFVGEAPGREEDLQGLPFVGKAGTLLTKIIQAMGFQRQDVYICNILKCRPPENRNPLPEEIIACQDYLSQQLEMIKPKVICCLGKFACFTLLKQDMPISKLRGNFFSYRGIKVMPTFHPAYLLRNPQAKHLVWQDMQKVMKELGHKQ
ncbi:MAG: uracil-DNA glycosylase [Candidatus Omnitrophica bacterium]|nr:uracil-DNA glycosylase [Candidatus Omnitrophota bacterium]